MSCKVFHSFLATLLLSEKFLLGCSPPPLQIYNGVKWFSQISYWLLCLDHHLWHWLRNPQVWAQHHCQGTLWSLLFLHWSLGLFRGPVNTLGILQTHLLPRNSPTIHTTIHIDTLGVAIHIDTLGVVSRSRDTPFFNPAMSTPRLGHLKWGPASLSRCPRKIKVQNIKSHQNINTSCPTFHPAPFLPATSIALVLNGLHITSNQLSSASVPYYTPMM